MSSAMTIMINEGVDGLSDGYDKGSECVSQGDEAAERGAERVGLDEEVLDEICRLRWSRWGRVDIEKSRHTDEGLMVVMDAGNGSSV